MKKYIFIIAALMTLSACTSEKMPDRSEADGKVRVEFRLPSYYGEGGSGSETASAMTKGDVLDTPRDLENMKPGIKSYPLPEGSTLWLTISKKQGDGTFTKPELKAYQVRDAGGFNTLYSCDIISREGTDRGEKAVIFNDIDTTGTSAPLYLEPGTYKFKMISPALEIIQEEGDGDVFNWKLPIDNGMFFCSTDGRYEQTKPLETVISAPDASSDNYIQYITLNPMIHQTAKMEFRIVKDEATVDSLAILPAGIEISGLQNPGLNASYYWTSENIADTLVMKMGDKRSWTNLHAEEMTVQDEVYSWDVNKDLQISDDERFHDALFGEIGVLPTDSRSTTIIITFNLLVNGIPTQYVTTMNQIILEHGHSYILNLKVKQERGITVFTWQYQSWSADLELDRQS